MGCVKASVTRIGRPVVTVTRVGKAPTVRCSPVCGVSVGNRFLRVTPEVLWLVDGYGEYEVESNTGWKVE